MSKPVAVYRLLVACGAWAWVGFIVLAAVRAIFPPVQAFFDDPALLSAGHLSLVAVLALFLLLVLVGWVAALLHVVTNPAVRSPLQRAIIIAFLLFVNVAAPFIYYFAYLAWAPKTANAAAAV